MNISSPRSWLLLSIFLLLVGAVWIWLSRADPGALTAGKIPAPRQGFLAPNFTLQDASGRSVQLADLRGRPVLVNIWASWCGPCKAEMPALQRLYQNYQARGFEILAVNSTSQDSRENALTFAQNLGLTFPILFDTQGEVARLYQAPSLPSSFFVDKDGMIQEVVIGGPMADALLRVRVDRLFGSVEPSSAQPAPTSFGEAP
jgi:cytochrome c biogenesis protein CcmG/thiol:disulfide interchange protein DsbE